MAEYCKVSQLKLNTVYITSMIFLKLPYYNFDYNQKKRDNLLEVSFMMTNCTIIIIGVILL